MADQLGVQSLLHEINVGASVNTHLAVDTKKQRFMRNLFITIVVVVILAGVAVGIYLAVRSIGHIDSPTNNNNNNTPPYIPPPSGPQNNGGIPLTGPGSGKGCYPKSPTSAYMPDGCTKERNPEGQRWEWGVLDISSSQPPYVEQEGCGGSCGDIGAKVGVRGTSPNPISQVLVCPPGKVQGVTPANAPYKLSNPYPHPVMVRSLAFRQSVNGATRQSFNGVDATSKNGDWACYWNTDFDSTTGEILPGAQPALVPPGTTVALSYGFDGGKETQKKTGEAAALAFIIPQCTNHGPAWKQISGAYPPCQDAAPVTKFVGEIEKLSKKVKSWTFKEGKEAWNKIKKDTQHLKESMDNAGHDVWNNLAKTSGVITHIKQNIDKLKKDMVGEGPADGGDEGDEGDGADVAVDERTPQLARMQLSLWDEIKDGLDKAAKWIEKETCICGDPLLPSNPGCPHFWDLGSKIAPSTGSYFSFSTNVINADPIPQLESATAVAFPTNQTVINAAKSTTDTLKTQTVAEFLKANSKSTYAVQPLFPPMKPKTPFKTMDWDGNSWVPQFPMCSEAGLTK